MSGIIHFSSGKTLAINEYEFQNIPVTLNGKGIKVQRLKSGHIVPMNSMTMEFIEYVPEVEEEVNAEPREMGENAMGSIKARTPVEKKPEPKEERKTDDEIMADVFAKSNCQHEPEKMVLYVQHTAKGIRYFPVCSFCGKRDRYVSESKIVAGEYAGTPNEKWTEADLASALPWIDK